MKKLLIATITLTFLLFVKPILAQNLSIGVAKYIPIREDQQVENGDIISLENGEYIRSYKSHDPNIVGVVTFSPALEIKPLDITGQYAVLETGETKVRVSGLGGNIEKGDLITTSENPGVGIKSTGSGFMLGIAKQDYTPENPEDVSLIIVTLQPSFSIADDTEKLGTSILDIFSLSTIAAYESPSKVLKHIIAAFVLILSIILGFLTFGRIAAHGVEAVGRNPSAKATIGLGIAINVVITVVIVASGVFISFLIITL